jgi:hypothetical protein
MRNTKILPYGQLHSSRHHNCFVKHPSYAFKTCINVYMVAKCRMNWPDGTRIQQITNSGLCPPSYPWSMLFNDYTIVLSWRTCRDRHIVLTSILDGHLYLWAYCYGLESYPRSKEPVIVDIRYQSKSIQTIATISLHDSSRQAIQALTNTRFKM